MLALLLLILWPIAELFVAIKVARGDRRAAHRDPAAHRQLAGRASWLTARRGARRLAAAECRGGRGPSARPRGDRRRPVLVGGVMLIIPGFITDVLGLLLLLRPTRGSPAPAIARNFRSRAGRPRDPLLRPAAVGLRRRLDRPRHRPAASCTDERGRAPVSSGRSRSETSTGGSGAPRSDGPGRSWRSASGGSLAVARRELDWTVDGRGWRLTGDGFELHVEPRGEDAREPGRGGRDRGGVAACRSSAACRARSRSTAASAASTASAPAA